MQCLWRRNCACRERRLAQQTSTGPNRDTGSGTVSTETGETEPIANPKVKGDKSTIKGDKRATTEQRTGSE